MVDRVSDAGGPPPPSRRSVLKQAAVMGGALAAGLAAGPPSRAAAPPAPLAPGGSLGRPVSPYGARSPFEAATRVAGSTNTREASWTFTPLQELCGSLTPSALHFERHHAGVPDLDPARQRLLIHGLVERPVVLTMADLHRLPAVSRVYMIECSGNTGTEWGAPTMPDVQRTHGLTSCSEWTGVLLATLLREVGPAPAARWVLAEGEDGAAMTRSLPLEKCWADTLLAYGQNGEALRPEQGYPLRLVVPGWEGNTHVKWLRRLQLRAAPTQTREETSKYTDLMPDGTARQFTFVMEAKSVITFPSGSQRLPGPGFYEVRGLAWSGRGRVRGVEVSTDGGRTWQAAALQGPVLPMAHTRFRLPWRWDGREAVLQSRCTDETGYLQPSRAELLAVRGLHSHYHLNAVQSWRVAADGRVWNVHA
jgi:sulfane dehydrogenase subunit SoxC